MRREQTNPVIRLAHPSEAKEIHAMIKNVFDLYIAPDYSEEGVRSFYLAIEVSQMEQRILTDNQCYVAIISEEIIGVLDIRDISHIRLLFVKPQYHRKGIAKSLFQYAFKDHTGDITVNSSPYAVGIYEKLGFEKVSGELIKNGITYIPMICEK